MKLFTMKQRQCLSFVGVKLNLWIMSYYIVGMCRGYGQSVLRGWEIIGQHHFRFMICCSGGEGSKSRQDFVQSNSVCYYLVHFDCKEQM